MRKRSVQAGSVVIAPALVVALFFIVNGKPELQATALPDLTKTSADASPTVELARLAAPLPIADSKAQKTVRDFLREFYGADWAQKEGLYGAQYKKLLDRKLSEVEPIRPWKDVAEQVIAECQCSPERVEKRADAALDWDPATDQSWENISKQFANIPPNMGERQLLEFQAIVKLHNEPIRMLALQQSATLADALSFKLGSQQFEKGPYALPGKPQVGRRAAMSASTASKTGWCVNTFIYFDELPADYEANSQKVLQMVDGRTSALYSYLKTFN